ncbi:hypothetical protein K8R30_00555 [archaeon]|nr:hypothetical protein [archaeon]
MKFFGSFLVLIVIVSLMGSVFALDWNICIDKQAPEAPGSLSASGNVVLNWGAAPDSPESTPDCTFGIEYYNIYLDGVLIGTSSGLSYSGDALGDGLYVFEVSAVDRAGNKGERAIKEVVFPLSDNNPPADPGNGGSSGGGSSGGGSSGGSSSAASSDDDDVLNSSSDESDNFIESTGSEEEEIVEEGFFSMVTGAVVGAAGTTAGMASGAFFILVILGFVAIKIRKKKV